MKIINPEFNPDVFDQHLADAKKRVLFLDYDGTLAPFNMSRDKAFPYPGIREILNEFIENRVIRVVIISGRWTRDLIPLLGLRTYPEIWGSHGLERLLPDGSYEMTALDDSMVESLEKIRVEIEKNKLMERCEIKPYSIAIHWRGLSAVRVREVMNKVNSGISPLIKGTRLVMDDFDGGIEIRVPGRNKGYAVDTVLSESGDGTAAAYLGDDFTDEDAFISIKGYGVGVLVREEFRETEADLWLIPPGELIRFLEKWIKFN